MRCVCGHKLNIENAVFHMALIQTSAERVRVETPPRNTAGGEARACGGRSSICREGFGDAASNLKWGPGKQRENGRHHRKGDRQMDIEEEGPPLRNERGNRGGGKGGHNRLARNTLDLGFTGPPRNNRPTHTNHASRPGQRWDAKGCQRGVATAIRRLATRAQERKQGTQGTPD